MYQAYCFTLADIYLQLLGDMSTWRSELKKVAIAHAPVAFNLLPPDAIAVPARAAWVENAASQLLQQSVFLRNGVDQNVSIFFVSDVMLTAVEQGKTNNFAHPALKHAVIEFFYTGSYHIADKRANLFRTGVPLPCLALVGAAVSFLRSIILDYLHLTCT